MVQQISQTNPQAAQPQPAGRNRPEGTGDFRSLIGSEVRKTGAEAAAGEADGKSLGRSGGKRTNRGTEQQDPAMGASVPVSPYPAGFLLPSAVGLQTAADAAKTAAPGTAGPVSALEGTPGGAQLPAGPAAAENGAADVSPGQTAMPQDGRSLIQGAPPQAASEIPPQETAGRPQEAGEPEMPVPAQGAQTEAGVAAEEPSPAAREIPTATQGRADGGGVGPPGQPEQAPGQPGVGVVSGPGGSPENGAAANRDPERETLGGKPSAVGPGGGTEQRKDVSAASLSDLYGNGNVVIRVSEKPAEKAPSPLRQVADAAADQFRQGKSELKMELYPQSLGKVEIRLTSGKGLLTVEIAASDPKTQSLLLSGSDEIRNILQASTGQPVHTLFPDRQEAGWYGGGQSEQGDGGGNPDRQRRRKEEAKDGRFRVDGVSADMNTGDFLAMIQSLSAFAR